MQRKWWLLSFMIGGLVGCNQQATRPPERKETGTVIPAGEVGSHLPDFTVEDLHGHKISSADLQGEVVLIDFWATWCQPCKKEMPGYQKLLDSNAAQGFVVIGFKFDTMKDTEEPTKFAKKIGVKYPLAIATDDLKQKFGGVEGLPTTFLYDRQGVLRQKVVGFEYTDTIESYLKHLL